jgi:hypothetical protein
MAGAIVYFGGVQEDLSLGVGTVDVPMPGQGTLKGRQINLATFGLFSVQSFPGVIINSGLPSTLDFAVPGARLGDMVMVQIDTMPSNGTVMYQALVGAIDIVRVMFNTVTVQGVVNGGTIKIIVFRLPDTPL